MKRTIEIDDTLDERIERATSELKENIGSYIKTLRDNTEKSNDIENIIENWYQGYNGKDDTKKAKSDYSFTGEDTVYGCDLMNEITDSNTPIYNAEIDGLHYLYPDLMDEFHNQGMDMPKEAWQARQQAIYLHIESKLHEAYDQIFKDLLVNE